MTTKNKRLITVITIVLSLLLIPFIAMRVTDEVNWTLLDFLIAGVLLLSTGLAIEFVIRKVKRTKYRIALIVSLLAILFLIWVELAVGIFGTVPIG